MDSHCARRYKSRRIVCPTTYPACLCRYWLAEGMSQHRTALLVGTLSPSSCVILDDVADRSHGECDDNDWMVAMDDDDGCSIDELRESLYSLPWNMHVDIVMRSASSARKCDRTRSDADDGDGGGCDDDGTLRDCGLGMKREPISAIVEEEEE